VNVGHEYEMKKTETIATCYTVFGGIMVWDWLK